MERVLHVCFKETYSDKIELILLITTDYNEKNHKLENCEFKLRSKIHIGQKIAVPYYITETI